MSARAHVRGNAETLWTAAWLQAKMTVSSPLLVVGSVLSPITLLCLLTLPRPEPPTQEEATAIVGAVILAAFWAGCVWGGVGVIRRERQNGTLASSLTAVRDPRAVVVGKILGACAVTFVGVAASVAVTGAALGLRPQFAHPAAMLVGLALTIATGVAASLLIGCLLVVSRHGAHIANALGVPVTVLGGTIIPPEVLPTPIDLLPRLVSLSWLHRWMSSTATPQLDGWSLAAAVALTGVYAGVGLWLFQRVLRKARVDGSLELI